jgi:hypothetical protein
MRFLIITRSGNIILKVFENLITSSDNFYFQNFKYITLICPQKLQKSLSNQEGKENHIDLLNDRFVLIFFETLQ